MIVYATAGAVQANRDASDGRLKVESLIGRFEPIEGITATIDLSPE